MVDVKPRRPPPQQTPSPHRRETAAASATETETETRAPKKQQPTQTQTQTQTTRRQIKTSTLLVIFIACIVPLIAIASHRLDSAAFDRHITTLLGRNAPPQEYSSTASTVAVFPEQQQHPSTGGRASQSQVTPDITSVKADASVDTDADRTSMASSVRRAAPLVFQPVGKHTATVIFAHGLGDSGNGWADAVQHWQRRQRLNEVKFVLPNAPVIPITVSRGFQMPGWFDIKSLGDDVSSLEARGRDEDAAGVLASRAYIHSLVEAEMAGGVPADRIVLGGFSQGGAMAIFAGLTAPFKLAGIVGMSSWLLQGQNFREHLPAGSDPNKATPVLMAHGDADPVVRYELATETEKALKGMSYDVTLRTYRGMGHTACLEELDEVEAFLLSWLPAKGGQ